MPRPLLSETFAIEYRKIPILAIGRELYCDTSLIIEALEHYFPTSAGYGTIYPKFDGVDEWTYKGLVRGFASFWTDKPLFRTTTGLIPPSVWSSPFGTDRSQLIGHALDPSKLGAKLPQNLASLDLHLSMLEPTFKKQGQWAIPTATPSLADISLYYQLRWGIDIAAGKGIYNLTGGNTPDTNLQTTAGVFNETRYPGLWAWFHAFEKHIAGLPDLEKTVPESDVSWKQALKDTPMFKDEEMLVATPSEHHADLDSQRGLEVGKSVSISPDDTGRDNPTVGEMVGLGVEEVVIKPGGKAEVPCRVHFPRLGFVIRVIEGSRL